VLPCDTFFDNSKTLRQAQAPPVSSTNKPKLLHKLDHSFFQKQQQQFNEDDACNSSIESNDLPPTSGHHNDVMDGLPGLLFGQQDLVRTTVIPTQNLALKSAMQ